MSRGCQFRYRFARGGAAMTSREDKVRMYV